MAEQIDSERDTFLLEEGIDTEKYISEKGKSILREWLKTNWKHSIPSNKELENLSTKTGSTQKAVKYALSNIRLKFLVEWIGKENCGKLPRDPKENQPSHQQQQNPSGNQQSNKPKKEPKENQSSIEEQQQENPARIQPSQQQDTSENKLSKHQEKPIEDQQSQHDKAKVVETVHQPQIFTIDKFQQKKSKEGQSSPKMKYTKDNQPSQQQKKPSNENHPSQLQKNSEDEKLLQQQEKHKDKLSQQEIKPKEKKSPQLKEKTKDVRLSQEQKKPKEETPSQKPKLPKDDQSSPEKKSREDKTFQSQKSNEDQQQIKSKNNQQSQQPKEIKDDLQYQQHQKDSNKNKNMLKSDSCRKCFLVICTDENVRKKKLMYKKYFYLQEHQDSMDRKDAWERNNIINYQNLSALQEEQDTENPSEPLSDIDEVSTDLEGETNKIEMMYKERLILESQFLNKSQK